MEKICKQYSDLLEKILWSGEWRDDPNRTGVKRLQIPFADMMVDLRDGFPAITTKKLYWKGVTTELLWFLSGSTDMRYLWNNNVSIWDQDYKRHLKKNFSEYSFDDLKKNWAKSRVDYPKNIFNLPKIYGKQWVDINGINQINELFKGLKENPLSSSHIVSAWNVSELNEMPLKPCHYSFQVTVSPESSPKPCHYSFQVTESSEPSKYDPFKYVDLQFNMRSSDVLLGLPFNIASYAALLELLACSINAVPRYLKYSGQNVHLYDNQIEATKAQLDRCPYRYELPNMVIGENLKNNLGIVPDFLFVNPSELKLENYESYGALPKTKMLTYDY